MEESTLERGKDEVEKRKEERRGLPLKLKHPYFKGFSLPFYLAWSLFHLINF